MRFRLVGALGALILSACSAGGGDDIVESQLKERLDIRTSALQGAQKEIDELKSKKATSPVVDPAIEAKIAEREQKIEAVEKTQKLEIKRLAELKGDLDDRKVKLDKRKTDLTLREQKVAKDEKVNVVSGAKDQQVLINALLADNVALHGLAEQRRLRLNNANGKAAAAHRKTRSKASRKVVYATLPGSRVEMWRRRAEKTTAHLSSVLKAQADKVVLEFITVTAYNTRVSELSQKIRRLKRQKRKANKRIAELERGDHQNTNTVKTTVKGSGEIAKLERQIERLEAQVENKNKRIVELEKIEKEQKLQIAKLKAAEEENKSLRSRVADLEREIRGIKNLLKDKTGKTKRTKKSKRAAKRGRCGLKCQLEHHKSRVTALEIEKTTLLGRLTTANKKVIAYEKDKRLRQEGAGRSRADSVVHWKAQADMFQAQVENKDTRIVALKQALKVYKSGDKKTICGLEHESLQRKCEAKVTILAGQVRSLRSERAKNVLAWSGEKRRLQGDLAEQVKLTKEYYRQLREAKDKLLNNGKKLKKGKSSEQRPAKNKSKARMSVHKSKLAGAGSGAKHGRVVYRPVGNRMRVPRNQRHKYMLATTSDDLWDVRGD